MASVPSPQRDDLLRESLTYAAGKLKIPDGKFKDLQEKAIRSILEGNDVFVALPTGFGKSAIFEAIPLCCDFLRKHHYYDRVDRGERWCNETSTDGQVQTDDGAGAGASDPTNSTTIRSIALVISPLISLMRSQVTSLLSLGIPAVYLGDVPTGSADELELINGNVSVVYMSPESVLGKRGNELLMNEKWQHNLCAVVVDESHCITKWGQHSKKVAAFRREYGRLAEVRSLVPPSVPLVSLTATASVARRQQIIESLCLTQPVMVVKSPDRSNIRYSVVSVPTSESPRIFHCLREELKSRKVEMERTIIFCRTHRQSRELYEYFKAGVEDRESFAMYHSTTDQARKERVLASFSQAGGAIRVLFATVAFGMGVDCKGLTRIYHYGPPENVEDYVQETGRAGRAGENCEVVLVSYKGCTKYKVTEEMKGYMTNTSTCRRSLLLLPFEGDTTNAVSKTHRCCDICSRECDCGQPECKKEMFEYVESERKKRDELRRCRIVSEEKKEELRRRLTDFRGSIVAGCRADLLAGSDLSSGIPLSELNSLIDNCERISSLEMLAAHFHFFGQEQKIWDIFAACVVSDSDDPGEWEQCDHSESSSSASEVEDSQTLCGVIVYSSESD